MSFIRWAQHKPHGQHLRKNRGQTETVALPLDPLSEAVNKAPTLAVLMGFMYAGIFLWKCAHFSKAKKQF